MGQYETAFLISPTLEEEETEKIITQMAGVISKMKGKMIKEDRWGKRRLAYQIKKQEEAFYVFFHYEGESAIPNELERRFKQSEAILRFLTVKKESKENVRKKRKEVSPPEEVQKPSGEEERVEEEELAQEVLSPAKKTEEEE